MVLGVIHAVNTDDVDTKLGQVGDITSASTGICQGVYEGGGLNEGVVGVVRSLAWTRE